MQPILARLSIGVSRRVGDEVTNYTDNGITITAKKRESAINEAIFKYYNEKYNSMRPEEFISQYPEYRGEILYSIVESEPNSRYLSKPEQIRKALECKVFAVQPLIRNRTAIRYDETNYYTAITNKYSNIKPTYSTPGFIEKDSYFTVEVGQNEEIIRNGQVKFLVVLQPQYREFDINGSDVLIPETWESDIITLSSLIVMDMRQK